MWDGKVAGKISRDEVSNIHFIKKKKKGLKPLPLCMINRQLQIIILVSKLPNNQHKCSSVPSSGVAT